MDVDRDGYVDILAGGHEQDGFRTQVLWGDESGVYRAGGATLLPEVPGNGVVVDIDVADTDGDGDRDIVVNRTGDRSGAGFYRGYYVQLLAQTGPRSFMDLTTDSVRGQPGTRGRSGSTGSAYTIWTTMETRTSWSTMSSPSARRPAGT